MLLSPERSIAALQYVQAFGSTLLFGASFVKSDLSPSLVSSKP